MTKRTMDLDQIRVIQADNYKGNPRVYLEIMDQRILYSSPSELPEHYIRRNEFGQEEIDTDSLADVFRAQLGHILAKLLLEARPDLLEGWHTDTDRDIYYTKPRLEESPYES